jgi:hypothetical protein
LFGVFTTISIGTKSAEKRREKETLTICGEEGNGGANSSCTTGPANTVNIVLRIVWIVIVDHMRNIANIF